MSVPNSRVFGTRVFSRWRYFSWLLWMAVAIDGLGQSGRPLSTFQGNMGNNNNGFPSAIPGQGANSRGGAGNNGNGTGIDDSTRVIYGPKSVQHFFEQDVFENRKRYFILDTSLARTHLFHFIGQNEGLYQDLGIMGTAMQRIFYKQPAALGQRPGADIFSPYFFQSNQTKYYNTKSPYSRIYFVTGGAGQNVLQIDFARNVDSLWNVGFNLQRATSFKQYGFGQLGAEEFLTENWGLTFHTNYQSKNKKYLLLAHWIHGNHSTTEQGGAATPDANVVEAEDILGRDNNVALLDGAFLEDHRNNLHAYQQYVSDGRFQFYHVFDFQAHSYNFQQVDVRSELDNFYQGKLLNLRSVADTGFALVRYTNLENKVGIKGQYRGFNYRLHSTRRDFWWTNLEDSTENTDLRRAENFLGLWVNQRWRNNIDFVGEAEYLLLDGDYRWKVEINTPQYLVGWSRMSHSPNLMSTRLGGNFYSWRRFFENTLSDQLYGQASRQLGAVTLGLSADLTRIENPVYFDTLARPVQASGAQVLYRLGLSWNWAWRRWKSSGQGAVSTSTGSDVLRFPKIWLNGRISYDFRFAKVLYIQTGFELTYFSSYRADSFMPAAWHFYQQNDYATKPYLIADLFANLRINRTRLFFKMSHVSQGSQGAGYFVRPYYPLTGRVFGFGFNWLLFD
jgi:Putative porin